MTYTAEEYRNWILRQTNPFYKISVPNDSTIQLAADCGTAEIVFHDMDIIELMIRNKKDDSYSFYLHFQLQEREHAQSLFHEMQQTLLKLKAKQKLKILLSCTGGLTTNYFAMELNKAAETLKIDYEFNAVAYNLLYESGFAYDVILLAPQIHYLYEKVSSIFRRTLVLKIPAAVFAQYNTGELISFVRDEYEKYRKQGSQEQKNVNPEKPFDNDLRILTLAFINHRDMFRIAYRIYDHGKKTLDKEIIKETFVIRDIEDLLDYITARHKKIDAISIAVPGVTYHGFLNHPELGFLNHPLGQSLSEKYGKPVILVNDVNAVAQAYRVMHENCDNMVFYFQPLGLAIGGAGVIIDGKLHRGFKHAAGEVGPVASVFIDDADKKIFTPGGALEIVVKNLLVFIMSVAPEKIVVFSTLTPNMDEIRAALAMYVSEEYIPELIHVDGLKEYMLPGAMIHCLEVIKSDPDWIRENTVVECE